MQTRPSFLLHTHSTAPNTSLPLPKKASPFRPADPVPAWPLSCLVHVLVITCLNIHSLLAFPLLCMQRADPCKLHFPGFSVHWCPAGSTNKMHWWEAEGREKGKGQHISLFSLLPVASTVCSQLLPGVSPQMAPAPRCWLPLSSSSDLAASALGKHDLLSPTAKLQG